VGRASQVPDRARLFLKFLVEVICKRDAAWKTEITVACSCGTQHRIVPAEWLAKIKCDSWVPVEKEQVIVQREANQENINLLVGADFEALFFNGENSKHGLDLLEHLGYDRLDLSIKKTLV